jgi:hypothetical protein
MEALHGVDMALSRLVFHSTLPASVEWILSPLWIWHGCPLTALALGPWIVVGLAQPGHNDAGHALWLAGYACVGGLLTARWFWLLAAGDPDGIYLGYVFMPPIVAATTLFSMWVDKVKFTGLTQNLQVDPAV